MVQTILNRRKLIAWMLKPISDEINTKFARSKPKYHTSAISFPWLFWYDLPSQPQTNPWKKNKKILNRNVENLLLWQFLFHELKDWHQDRKSTMLFVFENLFALLYPWKITKSLVLDKVNKNHKHGNCFDCLNSDRLIYFFKLIDDFVLD